MSPSISFITSWRRSSSILRSTSVRGFEFVVFVVEGDTSALDEGALAFALAFAFTTVFAVAFAAAFTAWRGLDFAVMRGALLPESDSWLSPASRARSVTSASEPRPPCQPRPSARPTRLRLHGPRGSRPPRSLLRPVERRRPPTRYGG